ncbi:MAG: acriflavin resistance protein [Gemmatimonadetes bacterium]|nr:acriflavin resistance protein [Gemmatimonadota bacterium]
MWIVHLALRRPYTFVCVAILMLLFGVLSIRTTPIDIFPAINIPLVSVIWNYGGLSPRDMEQRIVSNAERTYSSVVGDVEHIESESLNGTALIKVYLQPTADVATAVAQLAASSSGILRQLPPGVTPPYILRFNATDVPILQLGVSSPQRTEAQLNDLATNFIRTPLATIQGLTIPPANGGVSRVINVDIDPAALYAKGLSPTDVTTALGLQNILLPSGTMKMGAREYFVRLNSTPDSIQLLGDMPIRDVNGTMIFIRDVAQVRDGSGIQTTIVHNNGHRGLYLTMLKNGNVSTLAVVSQVKAMLPRITATLPADVKLTLLADQSVYVSAAVSGVIREGAIAACLTALMILIFLGSGRSTLIVATSIPLSILTSIVCLSRLGQSLNVMTLTGLALAVGVLVDDATVAIENIHRHLQQGKELTQAIVDASEQIALPALVSTLAICIVFLPIFALSGPAAALFRPLAMAVIFAMLASYFLSRTLVPTMSKYMLRAAEAKPGAHPGLLRRAADGFSRGFGAFRDTYHTALVWAVAHHRAVLTATALFVLASTLMVPQLGEDFFPQVDGGQFLLHFRAPTGTRVEETELIAADVENAIRGVIPASELTLVLSTIGSPSSGLNLIQGSSSIGPADADVLVQLTANHTGSTFAYVRTLRRVLPQRFPGVSFFAQPSDIVNQVLDLGVPAPIDVQVAGANLTANFALAQRVAGELRAVPGAVDVRVQQVMDGPQLSVSPDRVRLGQLGLTPSSVASNLLISLSSNGSTAPNFWLDPNNGVQYAVNAMTPQYKNATMGALNATPVSVATFTQPQLFGNLTSVARTTIPAVVNHYNIAPVVDVFLSADQRDLGGVAGDVAAVLARNQSALPRGSTFAVRGQVASMTASFSGLELGMVFAVLLVYILLVVNFQSWLDPLIIIAALPGALTGIVWMLFVTGTTLNVPSLMGAIMAMGVGTANSVLLITFAEGQRRAGRSAVEAAGDAGYARLRPVCMTALAMIIGMTPMALGMGTGGEQYAPLGRAVIGGLLMATVFTLFVVPLLYGVLRRKAPAQQEKP